MPQLARHLGRTLLALSAREAPAARALPCALYSHRSYATTATATRATKPTATVKKAVKAAAAEKPPPKKAAAPAKKTTAQKPAAKTTKKAEAKKPAAKKARPGRKRKVLTDEEKEKIKIRDLRAKALKEPVTQRALSAYNAFIAEAAVGKVDEGAKQATKIADLSRQFKELTPAQLEHYNHLAQQLNAANKAKLDAWINSHTPEEIRVANRARALLRKKLMGKQKSAPAYTSKLHDDRQVKTVPSAYIFFFTARHASGDFKNIKAQDASKLIGNEWKALSDAEKKKYEEERQAAKQRVNAA